MAETFTSDNTTESEVLSADEQDSLAVGEQLTEACLLYTSPSPRDS